MKILKLSIALGMVMMVLVSCRKKANKTTKQAAVQSEKIENPKRIVSIGASITEVIFALGEGARVVAKDVTSTYPKADSSCVNLGHGRGISAESILSQAPEMLITQKGKIGDDVLEQLETSGIKILLLEDEKNVEGAKKIISELGKVFEKKEKADVLVKKLENDLKAVKIDSLNKPKVLFVYARGKGAMNIMGKGTFAEKIIELAGGQLAVNEIHGFKALSPESLVKANPDFILFFESGLQSIGGVEGALKIPGISETKAGKHKQIIAMDGNYLSTFGPRLGKAIQELSGLISTSKP